MDVCLDTPRVIGLKSVRINIFFVNTGLVNIAHTLKKMHVKNRYTKKQSYGFPAICLSLYFKLQKAKTGILIFNTTFKLLHVILYATY
jgi:DUF1365 family protein